ncbi:MAG: DUF4920 domain-containing protein [Bacteroidota bacterium]
MKVFNILTAIFLLFQTVAHAQNTGFETYGASFEAKATSDLENEVFEKIGVKDTIATQVSGTIVDVCKAKGCWMKVAMGNEEEVFVKFKDYGFFVPTDSENGKVVMDGIAFVEEVSVDEQRHYAEDAGKSKEEVAKITKPKKTLRFEASGVQIKK